jgi:uncharacterized membrane protein (DUF485 family)
VAEGLPAAAGVCILCVARRAAGGEEDEGMTEEHAREPRVAAPASRLGLAMFGLYVMLYGGFITLVLVRPDLVAERPFGGVNLAITCGLGLILAAVLRSVVYMVARAGR